MALLTLLLVDLAGELRRNARSILTNLVHGLLLQVRSGLLFFLIIPSDLVFDLFVSPRPFFPQSILHGWITPSRYLRPWSDVHVSA